MDSSMTIKAAGITLICMLNTITLTLATLERGKCSIDAASLYFNYKHGIKESGATSFWFKGNRYAEYGPNGFSRWKEINKEWGLPSDLDAAFIYEDGNTWFAKDCTAYRYSDGRVDKQEKMGPGTQFDMPCPVDAAWDWGKGIGNLYFAKGNDYYKCKNRNCRNAMKAKSSKLTAWGVEGPLDAAFRWHVNNKLYFIKKDKYYRLNKGGIAGKPYNLSLWKGVEDELLPECPCDCERRGYEKNWEFYDMQYHFDRKKLIKGHPEEVAQQSIDNRGRTCPNGCGKVTFTAAKTISETKRYDNQFGMGLEIGTTFKTKVPFFFEGKIETKFSVSASHSWGEDKTETEEKSRSFECIGKPMMKVICSATLRVDEAEIPYTLTTRHKIKKCLCTSKGIYRDTSVSHMNLRMRDETA